MSAAEFINDVNTKYEALHCSFEEQFWGTKMALGDKKFSTAELVRTKAEMEAFLADEEKLKATREYLEKGASGDEETKTLKMLERTFGCYIMESAEALKLRHESTEIEGTLEAGRNVMKLGATIDGSWQDMSSVGLRNKMRTSPDESTRKACWDGMRTIVGQPVSIRSV